MKTDHKEKIFPKNISVKWKGRVQLFLVMAFFISGCGGFQSQFQMKRFSFHPRTSHIEKVPFYPQKAYQCGPSSLAMVLAYTGFPTDPEKLVPDVYIPGKKGSFQIEMMAAARKRNRLTFSINGIDPLIREISAGHPVIVFQNLGLKWIPKFHYAVVTGYDLDSETLTLHTGISESRRVPSRLFLRTWKRMDYWGMIVLNPGDLPVSVDEKRYLETVIDLERTQQWGDAAKAYEAALMRWHDSLGAIIGLGNSKYAQKDKMGAKDAFERAISLHPEFAPAYNNLAHIHSELGEYEKAIYLINRAIELGGPHIDLFRKTLREIEEKKRISP